MRRDMVFSVVMATYNSEKTIRNALKSIRDQDFDQNLVEILVIDGGSSDRTREIAQEFDAIVLDNPERVPENAKIIGINKAKGKYVCIMDSDEVMINKNSFKNRLSFFENNDDVYCIFLDCITPVKSPPCRYYINEIGDPFSCFVYGLTTKGWNGLIISKSIRHDGNNYVARYEPNDIWAPGDSCTVMDLDYIKSSYPEEIKKENTVAIFDRIIRDTGLEGYIAGDGHEHYSNADISTFFMKLKFRIVNNIFEKDKSGFSSKEDINRALSKRKYFYPLYCLILPWTIIDGIIMAVRYSHWVFLLHPVFAWYVMMEILIQYAYKLMGRKMVNKSYAR